MSLRICGLLLVIFFGVSQGRSAERMLPPSSFSTFQQIRSGARGANHLLSRNESSEVAVTADYLTDVLTPVAGRLGSSPGGASVMGCFLLGAEVDLERAIGTQGTTFFAQGLITHGSVDDIGLGDAQGMSGIQSPALARLYQFWLEQKIAGDRVGFLGGIHDVNTEFNLTDSSALFVNSSFGMGPEFSMSGVNGASTYPATSLGGRVRWSVNERFDVKAALYNGVAGSLKNPMMASPDFAFGGKHGVMAIGEASVAHSIADQPGKVSLGGWTYSRVERSRGAYVLLDQKIYSPSPGAEMGLYGFLRAGFTPNPDAFVSRSVQTGLSYRGPFGRMSDQVGLGLAVASGRGDTGRFGHEQTYELTYQAKLTESLALQPDLQWVVAPGMDSSRRSGLVAGFRAQVGL